MHSFTRALALSALLAMANGQAVLLSAKGDSGESLALQLNAKDAKDANIINDAEIDTNIVNQCGRTLLNGNIDIGQNTENALADGKVTKVAKGSKVVATFRQVNEQGAGPFTCDMDQTSNSLGGTGQTKLQVQESPAQNGNIKLTINMPADMKLSGASNGITGMVRCRNKLNFGSCFAVQQTDTTPTKNTPQNIKTAQEAKQIKEQVEQDKKDLPAVTAVIAKAKNESEQGAGVVDALLKNNPQVKQANETANAGACAGKKNNSKGKKNNANGKNRGNANGANRAAGKKKKAGKNNNAAARKNNNAAARKNNNAAANNQKRDDEE